MCSRFSDLLDQGDGHLNTFFIDNVSGKGKGGGERHPKKTI
jgi:hypothetical protein